MVKYIKRILGIDAGSKIQAIVLRFSSLVDSLQSAVSDINGDIADNQDRIQDLKRENTGLGTSKVEALKLIKGLNELLGK